MDDGPPLRSELGRLADRLAGLEAALRKLQRQVDELAGDRPSSDRAKSPVPKQRAHSPTGEGIDVEALAKWVDQLQQRYAAAGDWLRPCWWRHGLVVEELAALHTAWMGVYKSDEPTESTAALNWHEAAERCRERIRRAIGSGPGCTAVSHKPEQSVTDDPRWAEERTALCGETPSLSGPEGTGADGEALRSDNGRDHRESPSDQGSSGVRT